MAIDKAIDSVKLESDLSSIADAIRSKGGTSGELVFPAGFVSAIAAISAGGGNVKVASGKITPTETLNEIKHGLGVVPELFMYYTTLNSPMTGRTMEKSNRIADNEQAYSSKDWNHVEYRKRPMLILTGDTFYSYSLGANTDWGFFTVGRVSDITDPTYAGIISLDEESFFSLPAGGTHPSIIPHSTNGNVNVHWLAVGSFPA